MNKRLMIGAALLAATMGVTAQKTMKAPAGGKVISDELIGIFFEDISNAADGGLYAELVQNGSFEFSPAERDGKGASGPNDGQRHGRFAALAPPWIDGGAERRAFDRFPRRG